MAPVSTSRLSGTYSLTAVCPKSCGGGFLHPNERVTLVLNGATVSVIPASREALARLRWMYYLIAEDLGPANACFTVASADGKLRLVRLAHWSRYPDDSVAVVTMSRSVDSGYRILLTLSGRGAVGYLPIRTVPVPDSLVQLTGVRSGPADPEQCTRAAGR